MSHWGPLLWKLLHGLAEKLGTQKPEILAADEAREMVLILRGLEVIMPCEKCRKHYKEYRVKNPYDVFMHRRGLGLKRDVREWLYMLHETVNKRNGVESRLLLEDMEPMYKDVKIQDAWAPLNQVLMTSVSSGLILSENLKSFRRHLSLLLTAIG
jgi:Erv1 / Alr family